MKNGSQEAALSTEVAAAPQTALTITPMQMLQIAVEQNADLEKLSKLMDLQERWEANEARKAFVTAMTAFKKTPPEIVKDTHVSFKNRAGDETEYDHPTLDQVCAVIAPALAEHGLAHAWEMSQEKDGQITVTCIITHEGGHSKGVSLSGMPDTSGGKNAIQAVASTVTYLERYTLMAATGSAAKGQDDDGRGAGTDFITPEQKEELVELMKASGADTAKFLAYLGVETLDELPAHWFDNAKAALEKKGKAA